MKKLKKILRRIVLIILSLFIILIIVLTCTGLPRPAGITTENVPRIKWDKALAMYRNTRKGNLSTYFKGWVPGEDGIYVRAMTKGLRHTIHKVDHPGAKPEQLRGIPKTVRQVIANPSPEIKCLIYAADKDGDEQYQLYRCFTEDQTSILFTDGKSRNRPGRFNSSGTLFTFQSNARNGKDFDIWMMDVYDSSSIRMIFKASGSWAPGEWSKQSDRIILGHYVSANESYRYILDIESGELSNPFPQTNEMVSYGTVRWGKGDSILYYVSDYQSEFSRLHMLNLNSGTDTVLTAGIPWDINRMDITASGNWLALAANENGLNKLYKMNCNTLEISPVEGLPKGTSGYMKPHPVEDRIAFTYTCCYNVSSVKSYNFITGEITDWTASFHDHDPLPEPVTIYYPTFDSIDGKAREITAFVMKPGKATQKPYPVLIDIHGGPESQASPIMNSRHEELLNHGIAIIRPNVRGSEGYGKQFLKLDNGYQREDAVRDIGALLDWIETRPDLDASRIGVYGGSYGGYMALASAVHFSDRLKCCIDLFGIAHFVTFLENTSEYRRDLRRAEYGDERFPEMNHFLDSISPLNHADKIDIPILIYQGANDPRVPLSESLQMAEKIRETGKEVWYIEASNEGHGISNPLNRIFVNASAATFIEDYLLDGNDE